MQFLLEVMDVMFGFHPLALVMVLLISVAGVLVIATLLLLAATVYIMWVRRKYSHIPTPPVSRYAIHIYMYINTCREGVGENLRERESDKKENVRMKERKREREMNGVIILFYVAAVFSSGIYQSLQSSVMKMDINTCALKSF